ncbi:hypothetical protein ACHAPT_005121 [Fusarium lateritium]
MLGLLVLTIIRNQIEYHSSSLEARLAKVERQLATPEASSVSNKPTPDSGSPSVSAESKIRPDSEAETGDIYEGSTSFINQSVQASQVAHRTANSETPEAVSTISESLNHLEALLRPSATSSLLREHQFSTSTTSRPMPAVEPLPLSFVAAVLERIKTHGSIFLSGYTLRGVGLIEKLSQKVYFSKEPVSLGHVTGVNGIFYVLLREFIMMKTPIGEGYDLKALFDQCDRNFNLGIETYDVLAVPSFENVLSLTLGVIKAQNQSKPRLCCNLIASAASHCQILGYHRESTHQKDSSGNADSKRRLFWTLYLLDKSSSLLLGRAAKFQDFDIDAGYPALSPDPAQRPWDECLHLSIRLAKIQGQVYDRLYSAGALRATPTERKKHIDSLTLDLHKWRENIDQLDGSRVNYPQILDMSITHWNVHYYSALTSVLRAPAAPRTDAEISSQCFQAARLSLHHHLRCFANYQTSGLFTSEVLSEVDFADWILHNSSFTPFIVIFLHAIAASSLDDVHLLEQVIETLKSAYKSHSGSERLLQICAAFARLARRMVEARNSCVGMYDQHTDSLQLAVVPEDMPLSWSEAFADPKLAVDNPYGWEDGDMTAILTDWINGQPPATDMFGMDLG